MSGRPWSVAVRTRNAHVKAWRAVGDDLLRKLHPCGPEYAARLPREHLYPPYFCGPSDPRAKLWRLANDALDWCVAGGRYVANRSRPEERRAFDNAAYLVTFDDWLHVLCKLAAEVEADHAADLAREAKIADEARRRVVSIDVARARRAERWRPGLDRTPGPLTAAGQRLRFGVVVQFRPREVRA